MVVILWLIRAGSITAAFKLQQENSFSLQHFQSLVACDELNCLQFECELTETLDTYSTTLLRYNEKKSIKCPVKVQLTR